MQRGVYVLCACILLTCFIGFAEAVPFGDCIQYCSPDTPPILISMDSVCVIGPENCTFCKHIATNCPEMVECDQGESPKPTKDGRCLTCPGECIYEGNKHVEGSEFDSIDGVNQCACIKGGEVKCGSSETLPPPSEFCQ